MSTPGADRVDGGTEIIAETTADEARTRALWVLYLAGPTIWLGHFLLVYLLAEVLCKPLRELDLRLLGLPLVSFLTVVATAVAVAVALGFALRSRRRWRDGAERGADALFVGSGSSGNLALGGFLLGILFIVAILFTGAPALFLAPC